MKIETNISYEPLLSDEDAPVCEMHNIEGKCPLLLICDHAGNQIPKKLNNLGLTPEELNYHIGIDIGAAAVAKYVSTQLDAPAVLNNYSRLLIDCNRQPGDPTSICEISDGISIPGNQNLTESDEVQRTEGVFWPYHHAITEISAHIWRKGTPPAIVSIHSFTDKLMSREEDRPWHVAVLWKRDPRIAIPLIRLLHEAGDYQIGDNEPYSGWREAYTIDMHGATPGLPYCALEIRQDLIATKEGQEKWGAIIANALTDIFKDKSIFEAKQYN